MVTSLNQLSFEPWGLGWCEIPRLRRVLSVVAFNLLAQIQFPLPGASAAASILLLGLQDLTLPLKRGSNSVIYPVLNVASIEDTFYNKGNG